ncbi:reverse transcriptase domain-containing protein [Tanacetum coccineum]
MADRSMETPKGIRENVLVKISNFMFPVDLVVLDIMEDENVPIILGRPMLTTTHANIDVYGKNISLGDGNDHAPATEGDVDIQDEVDLEGLSRMASDALADISESAGPSVGADKGKAPMPDLEIPAEFLAEDAQARQRLEEEQASTRLVPAVRTRTVALNDASWSKSCIGRLGGDEVLAEILFRGQYVSGAGVVVVDKLPDDEIVDPRVKVEPISESASSPPRSRSKHRGVRSDTSLWDRPVDDFLSSESESDDDIEDYIPPIPYGAFKDWEIDLLLLRRRMNRYFRLNPDVDVGLDLWRDVNLLCQSLHSDDVEDFWRTQDEWVVSGWRLYPKSSVHVLDLTNGKTVYMFVDKFYPIRAPLLERMLRHRLTVPPSYCRDVVVAGSVIQTIQCLHCTTNGFQLNHGNSENELATIANGFGAKGLTSPEQTATGKGISNPLMAVMVCPKPYGIQLSSVSSTESEMVSLSNTPGSDENRLKFFDLMYILVNDHAGSFDAVVPSLVSAACVAARLLTLCSLLLIALSQIESADYVSAGHVLVPADRDRIC